MKFPEMTKRNQLLLVLVLIVIAVPSIFVYNYIQNDPKFCTTCHLMNEAYDTWQVSAMHDLACHDCHETSMTESIQHVIDVLTKNPEDVTKPVSIDNELCEKCHTSNDPEWLQVLDTAGHEVHIDNANVEVECIDCHGMELHIFRPPEEPCLKCHDVEGVHAETSFITECLTCHNFLVEGDDLIPTSDNCVECHSDAGEITVSMPEGTHIDTTCTNCHNPHGEAVAEDCTECHTVSGGLHDVTAHAYCTSCHVPHETIGIRDTCESCHLDKTEHYAPVDCTSCHQ